MDELIKRLRERSFEFLGFRTYFAMEIREAADALTSQKSRIAALELQVSGERGQKEIWETRAKEWCESSTALSEDNDSLRKSLNGESEARCALEDEVKALRKIARFAGLVLREHRNDGYPGDVDGDFLQGIAVETGLLEERRVESSCGSECSCADIGEFPTTCYFTTELGKAALSAASDGGKS